MIIDIRGHNNTVLLSKIAIGQPFMFDKDVWIKTDGEMNSVCLSDGVLIDLEDELLVVPADVKVVENTPRDLGAISYGADYLP